MLDDEETLDFKNPMVVKIATLISRLILKAVIRNSNSLLFGLIGEPAVIVR